MSTPANKPDASPPPRSIRVFARSSKETGATQLRMTVEEYKGHKFLKLQVWQATAKGGFAPTGKVVTIRAAEMEDFIMGAQEAEGFFPPSTEKGRAEERGPRPLRFTGR